MKMMRLKMIKILNFKKYNPNIEMVFSGVYVEC